MYREATNHQQNKNISSLSFLSMTSCLFKYIYDVHSGHLKQHYWQRNSFQSKRLQEMNNTNGIYQAYHYLISQQ